ncbi:MAG: DUF4097 domain-containing protein [Candidatus Cloacimonetes bacterium]|nr:DUF4097 domain-containing protein [Candidatus Cloacimonadota bacterium]MCF7814055.1 DUF4097 domain-containing protein [Candidatus Cloacimonadota bacterium]MCF7868643.1 DUF4097 domain-containing protein [Candidatus Cloacimonadota bacterium]MCF7884098.1 DUF4097 domain-containing protein [Candidatus Cloacimonadota bacterium]
MKKIIIFLAILSIAVLLYGISQTREINKTFEVTDNTELNLDNINGPINIAGWDKDYIDVTIIKKTTNGDEELEKVEVNFTHEKDLTIETKFLEKNAKVSVSYDLSVPRFIMLKNIHTSNGSISLQDVGVVDQVSTSNGSINLEKCEGKITADTSNGTIKANEINGSVFAYTSNGRIRLENVTGLVDAKTSNGSVKLFNVAAIENAKTSNGSIKAHLASLPTDTNLRTSNGSITVFLSENLNADIKASTSNGKVKLHDYQILASDISKSYVSGSIGNGGNLLRLSTSNASINIYNERDIQF